MSSEAPEGPIENSSSMMAHREMVASGRFDEIPEPEHYTSGEHVVDRRNSGIFCVEEVDGNTVRIWFDTEESSWDEIVARSQVRPINAYSAAYSSMLQKLTGRVVKIENADTGTAKVTYHTRNPNNPAPPFPGLQ